MNKTLLAIGDKSDWDSYLKFYRQRRLLKKIGFDFVSTDYDAILRDDFPAVTSKTVVVFPFFPFAYWDRHIEPRGYPGVYGNRHFYSRLKRFWKLVARKLDRRLEGKKVHFVNSPENVPTERDKKLCRQVLAAAGIETPRACRTRDMRTVLRMLRDGTGLFIKVRYGSMGKGITYLEADRWRTNFGFRGNRLLNRHSDYGWKFRDVTGNRAFLRELLKQDIVIERAVPRWLIRGRHFDLRLFVFYGRVLYTCPRSNVAKNVTTNVSQGGTPQTVAFLKEVSDGLIRRAERTGLKAARVLGLNFAGVDIMLDPDRKVPVVIEVNAFPGFPKMRTFNLARYLITDIGERRWK